MLHRQAAWGQKHLQRECSRGTSPDSPAQEPAVVLEGHGTRRDGLKTVSRVNVLKCLREFSVNGDCGSGFDVS